MPACTCEGCNGPREKDHCAACGQWKEVKATAFGRPVCSSRCLEQWMDRRKDGL